MHFLVMLLSLFGSIHVTFFDCLLFISPRSSLGAGHRLGNLPYLGFSYPLSGTSQRQRLQPKPCALGLVGRASLKA